jgi:hypothetical protein
MLSRLEGDIAELTTLLTQQRIREDGVVGSYRRVVEAGEYDGVGYRLYPNSTLYAGFKCPGCGASVQQTKRPIPIGQGQKAVVFSCVCLVYFLPPVKGGMKIEPMTEVRWAGYVDWLTREDPSLARHRQLSAASSLGADLGEGPPDMGGVVARALDYCRRGFQAKFLEEIADFREEC